MNHRRHLLLAGSAATWMVAGPSAATAMTWNGYEATEQVHIWRSGDTLAELLFKHGLGKQKGPLQIYGPRGWIRATDEHNKITDWGSVALGTPVVLILPKVLTEARPAPKPVLAAQNHPPPTVKLPSPAPAAAPPPYLRPAKVRSQLLNPALVDAGPEDERYDRPSMAPKVPMTGTKMLQPAASRADRVWSVQRRLAWPIGLCALVIITCAVVLLRPKERARRYQQIKLEICNHISQQDYAHTCRQMLLAASVPLKPRLAKEGGARIATLEHIKVFDKIAYARPINYEAIVDKINDPSIV